MECPPLAEDMVTCMCVGEAKVRDKVIYQPSGVLLLPSHHFLSLENSRYRTEKLTLGIIATEEE